MIILCEIRKLKKNWDIYYIYINTHICIRVCGMYVLMSVSITIKSEIVKKACNVSVYKW